jgi:hypothetical protein
MDLPPTYCLPLHLLTCEVGSQYKAPNTIKSFHRWNSDGEYQDCHGDCGFDCLTASGEFELWARFGMDYWELARKSRMADVDEICRV